MENTNNTLSSSRAQPEQQMPWLESTGGPKLQHISNPLNNLNLQHLSDPLTHRLTRSSGISRFLKARQNAAATPPRALAAETMTPQLSVASRARSPTPPTSPTSPTFSDLTPTPDSPTSSATNMAHDENRGEAIIRKAVQEYTAELWASPYPRAAGFESETASARQASREATEATLNKDSDVEDLQHKSPGHLKEQIAPQERDPNAQDPSEDMAEATSEATPLRDQTVAQEHRPEAQDEGEDMAESKPEVTPLRLQAAWVTEAVAACQANKKNPLSRGTVLIILDPTDLTKSCLLDAKIVRKTSDVLEKLYDDAQAKSAGCFPEQGDLTALLVLSSKSSASIPELVTEALDATHESVLPPQPDNHLPPSRAAKARHANADNTKVKKESPQGDSSPAASDDSEMPRIDWPKAYERFFRMVAGKKYGISKQDLEIALPHIQGVVQVAQRYGAVDAVKSTFTDLLLGYVENRTLYSTISKWPAHCLNIGIALENRLVYDEAFKHLVGESANFKEGKPFPDLPDDVQVILKRRSCELYAMRRDVEDKLMLMTLPGTQKSRSSRPQSPPEYPSQYVSQHDQRTAYDTVNIFRDWIMWHIGHLPNETSDEPELFYLCDHANDCTHVAGFYRTITSKDYLDPDEVYDNFDSHYKSARNCVTELEAVRTSLEGLKDTAAGYVEKLSESTLHLADRSGLRYLTCVKVEAEDVPWAVGEESDGGSDGGSDDDD